MKRVCIAGGIGSGKSVVSRVLRLRGCTVFDCDLEARHLMENRGTPVRIALEERYGAELYKEDGSLDRPRLAEIIFTDEAELEWCNTLVHRAVAEEWETRCGTLRRQGAEYAFIESAIPAGSGLTAHVEEVWLVTAPEEVRVRRAVARGMDEGDARRRIGTQRSEMVKLGESGVKIVIIDNSDSAPLLRNIERALYLNTLLDKFNK